VKIMHGPTPSRLGVATARRRPTVATPRRAAPPRTIRPPDLGWPPDRPSAVLLLEADGPTDRRVLADWAARLPVPVTWTADEALEHAADGDRLIVPARVSWLPPGSDGARRWRLRDLPLRGMGARTPERERAWIGLRAPERCAVVVGAAARRSELEAALAAEVDAPTAEQLTWLVQRRARLAVDRTERRVMGPGYKAARMVPEELQQSPRFQQGLERVAERTGRERSAVEAQAREELDALITEQDPLARDLWTAIARHLWSRAYTLDVDERALARLRELSEQHPLVFLPTHRSNLDHFVMSTLMADHGFPHNHTLGGRNFGFWPLGPIGSRVGTIWILRAGADDPVYRFVLRSYLAHLVEKRFNLEWYIEGARSRTGKLLAPKMGLLKYLVDAVETSGVDDVHLVPVSIVYDRLEEARDMTAESQGAIKTAEGARWFAGYARRQRGEFGEIHVNFAEPIRLSDALATAGAGSGDPNVLEKLAFQICTQLNELTPMTASGLVTLAMLGLEGRALTLEQVQSLLVPFLAYARRRNLPGLEVVDALERRAGVLATLQALVDQGVVSCYADGTEAVYAIGPENEHLAAFYRNGIVHWFVNRSILELALMRTTEPHAGRFATEVAWEEAARLRDLLKFEFFFSEKSVFRREILDELALVEPAWAQDDLPPLRDAGEALIASGALTAHRVLTSFVEAYRILADCLLLVGSAAVPRDALLAQCQRVGTQYRLQHRITSGEAVSRELFSSGVRLAQNRGLLEPGGAGPGLARRRAQFAEELADLAERIYRIGRLDREHVVQE
jgi:glycerol-3-phosphate O-acyltransferase